MSLTGNSQRRGECSESQDTLHGILPSVSSHELVPDRREDVGGGNRCGAGLMASLVSLGKRQAHPFAHKTHQLRAGRDGYRGDLGFNPAPRTPRAKLGT